MLKRYLYIMLSLLLVVSFVCAFPVQFSAKDMTELETSGMTGDCMWRLNGSMLTIFGNGSMDNYSWQDPAPWGTDITEVIVSDGVLNIGKRSFWGCKLTKVTIGNTVKSIEDDAFGQNPFLSSIIIPDSVTSIGSRAFLGCVSLSSFSIANSVTHVGNDAFKGTKWYSNQPEGLVYIGNILYSMKGVCPEQIEIKEGTILIAEGAIKENNQNLSTVILPDTLVYIDEGAFINCTNLKNISIPKSVKSIGSYAIGYKNDDFQLYRQQDIIITGYKDTEAERYANHNSFDFVELTEFVFLGDANGDGEVDSLDATIVHRAATKIQVPYSEEQLMCADIDGDGSLTIVDATFIQRYDSKIAVPYPVGEAK